MSVLTKITMILAALTITVNPALAVTDGRSHTTDYFVWGFLGCCALIIIAQIVPMIRNIRKQSKMVPDQEKSPEPYQP
jgi:hypothetical protein